MKTLTEIYNEIISMRERWRMYALTREGYLSTISSYLWVFIPEFSPNEFYRKFFPNKGASTEWLLDPLDESFAHEAADAAMDIIIQEFKRQNGTT